MARNVRGGYKITGLGKYGNVPPRSKKKLDGRCYQDAQPWHPDAPRVRVRQAFLVPRALFTALCALSGHQGRTVEIGNLKPGCRVLCGICMPGGLTT